MADHQDAGEQRETAAAGDGQGHARALAGFLAVAPEADQQKGRQASQLPEHHQQQQVFRQYHAQHGAHEQQQVGEEAADRLVLAQVIGGIEDHQQAHDQDHQGEHQAQAVQAQAEVQAQGRQPVQSLQQHGAVEHGRQLRSQQGQGHGRRYGGTQGTGTPPEAISRQRQQCS